MLKLRAGSFARSVQTVSAKWALAQITAGFESRDSYESAMWDKESLETLRVAVDNLSEILPDFDMPATLGALAKIDRFMREEPPSASLLEKSLTVLFSVLPDELESRYFLAMSAREAALFDSPTPVFGPEVETKFPGTVTEDVSEAAKCIACARYTAAVFHLMRALELGVNNFAALLHVTPIDIRGKPKNWQNFLDEVNAAIARLPPRIKRPKSMRQSPQIFTT